jgi:hypothetical protein
MSFQLSLFVVLLTVILGFGCRSTGGACSPFTGSGEWTLGRGVDLLLVALVQCFSYPFHDPVLTDRGGFIADTRTTRWPLVTAVIGSVHHLFFAVGIFAKLNICEAPVTITAGTSGVPVLLMNLIMVASASSTTRFGHGFVLQTD